MTSSDANVPRPPAAFVGIFWAVQKKGRAARLRVHRCSMKDAEPYGEMLTCPHGHYEIWERRRCGTTSRQSGFAAPEAMGEYEEWPRGRIVYNTNSGRFTVYADAQILRRPDLMAAIFEGFGLPADKTDTKLDTHYVSTIRLGSSH